MTTNRSLGPRKRPRQRRSRFTVEQILEAAALVFEEQGYAGGTTNHIAERAGVSIGSLYQYFPNKDAILVALQERHMRAGTAMIKEALGEALSAEEGLDHVLNRVVSATVAFHTDAPRLHHVLLFEAPRTPEVVELLHRTEESIAEVVEALLRDRLGVCRRHAGHAAYLIVHVVDTLAHEFVIHPPRDMSEEDFVAEVVTMLRSYLLSPCPSEG